MSSSKVVKWPKGAVYYVNEPRDALTLCTLGMGTGPAPTNERCELLRMHKTRQRCEGNNRLMEEVTSSRTIAGHPNHSHTANGKATPLANGVSSATNALPITQEPSTALFRAANVLRTLMTGSDDGSCLVGSEMVDWLVAKGAAHFRTISRPLAAGMWQVLAEEGLIAHVQNEYPFKDEYLLYRFIAKLRQPSSEDRIQAEDQLQDTLALLLQMAPHAIFRTIVRKQPFERSAEELEIVYEKLQRTKALSHLSNGVKRELAGVMHFEAHPKAGTVLFNQGDEGKSWFIILRGSVNVSIYGKGVVCTLHEGDDFGKLALVNDAPRAATIVTRESNCHFLRVDKDDFNHIIRDVEANTVRLKEHGRDVLLLQKIPTDSKTSDSNHARYKYVVMAGTPEKMLEHLLETRIGQKSDDTTDTFLEDFLLTHIIFMPSHQLCPQLMKHYRIDVSNCRREKDFIAASKKRVMQFVQIWATTVRSAFFEDSDVHIFLQDLHGAVLEDCEQYDLRGELSLLNQLLETKKKMDRGATRKWKVDPRGHIRQLSSSLQEEEDSRGIKASDEFVFRVYCPDHTYTTLKSRVGSTTDAITLSAAEKLGFHENHLTLAEVKSSGEKTALRGSEVGVPAGRTLFLCSSHQLDMLTPLPDMSMVEHLPIEAFNSLDIAYSLTLYEWHLFSCLHEYELIYHVFGRQQVKSNLDIFLQRFNDVQWWVVTEMMMVTPLPRRTALLRKFIKIAAHCREYKNLNGFLAIVMGLSNAAVSRLSNTWQRLPGKVKRTFADFEALVDPSRNHRRYRVTLSKMSPPIIPFFPLLLKDLTFVHEGNATRTQEGLLNFEKMHLIAQTLRTVRHCRSQPLELETTLSNKSQQDVRNYIRNLRVIDNQKRLTQLSETLEPRRIPQSQSKKTSGEFHCAQE